LSSLNDPTLARRAVIAATCGNALEFYDFVTYAYFAIQIGATFFPSTNPYLSLIGSLATFGAGFVARPVGAWVIGGYADRHGRKRAMVLSMLAMGIGIVVLALTPGYATIGLAAPVLAVMARLCQGFALGGEVGAATAYMLEVVPPERRGWAGSWQNSSQMLAFTAGAALAFAASVWLTEAQLAQYGWRLVLLAGTVILPFALVVRSRLPDDHGGHAMAEAAPEPGPAIGFWRVVVLGMAMIGGGTSATYCFLYMSTYAQNTLHLPAWVGMAGDLANNAAGAGMAIWGGWLSDRLGRRPVMIWPQLAFVVLTMPMFTWFLAAPGLVSFLVVNIVLSGLATMPYSAAFVAVTESLPRARRARAFALVYTLPVTTLGGSTQVLVTWLLHRTGNPAALAWYLTAVGVLALVAMVFLPESAPPGVGRAARRLAVA